MEAQGLARVRSTGTPGTREVGRTLAQLQLLQIDSVNVLTRSHYLPLFARLGSYDRALLDRFSSRAPRRLIEFWAHEASLVVPELFPHLLATQSRKWASAAYLPGDVRESLSGSILELLAGSQPLTAAQVQERVGHAEQKKSENWGWNWSSAKRVLEDLFQRGVISSAGRTAQFERRYALTQKVLPDPAIAEMGVPLEDAYLHLTERAASALGVGTARCFADYFRLPVKAAATAVGILVQRGTLIPVTVAGWKNPAYRYAGSVLPRAAAGRALLSPFDSAVFERRRLEALFSFRYRLEIYTPAEKREYGYYVLPFLLRDCMAARVDLKADRNQGCLVVKAAYGEPSMPADTAVELAAELVLMAGWLGLDHVSVQPHGDLAAPVAAHLAEEYGRELNRGTARLSRRLNPPVNGEPRLGANTSAITS